MKRMDTINVIPFIDIMLVLLAIVLATATFIAEGRLEIRLPAAESALDTPPEKPVEIAIDRDGQLFIDAEPTLRGNLESYLDGLTPATPIELRVDAAARFAAFVGVVDLLKARGLERVTILTQES